MNTHIISRAQKDVKSDTQVWRDKKLEALRVADKIESAGFKKRAFAMRECGRWLQMKKCPTCGKSIVSSASLCRDRLCPTCAWRLSRRRFSEMMSTLAYINDIDSYIPAFLTLTVRNVRADELRTTLSDMSKDWYRIISRRTFKARVAGWARSVEITFNRATQTFHPHYHILLLLNPDQNNVTQKEQQRYFRRIWRESGKLQYDPITDYREIISYGKNCGEVTDDKLAKAVLETYKYAVKANDLEDMGIPTLRQFIAATKGIRLAAFGGIIKEARTALNLTDEDEPDDETVVSVKCECGEDMLDMIAQWSFADNEYQIFSDALLDPHECNIDEYYE